jgi:DNA-3-methyladenine glycosylase II
MLAPPPKLAAMKRHLAKADPVLATLMRAAGRFTLEPQRTHSPFRSLVGAIANQQLNGIVAQRILARFVALYADCEFPTPEQVLATPDATLRGVGFSFAKIAALKDLADKTCTGVVPDGVALESLTDDAIVERLTQVRGIGRWTVEMMLMFQLGRADVLPVDDFGVRNGLRLAYGLRGMPTTRALADFGARWAPYRTMAAWYLWRAVDLHKAQRLPPPALKTRVKLVKRRAKPIARKPRAKRRAKSTRRSA